jgi:hypothetical protein
MEMEPGFRGRESGVLFPQELATTWDNQIQIERFKNAKLSVEFGNQYLPPD